MAADTKDFDVVRIARSDGADTGPGYWPSTNTAPKRTGKDVAAAAVEKTPRVKPQMTRLAEDDPRFIEWRIKLGILLKQELSPNPDGAQHLPYSLTPDEERLTKDVEGNPWYVQFPRGYWLYEKSKHLWVSGYPIKTKLYKSPQEFGVHLIWLLSASRDYKDCCCVHCNLPNPAKLAASVEETLIITPGETPIPVSAATASGTGVKSSSNTPMPAPVPAAAQRVTPVPLPAIPGQPGRTPPTTSATPATKPPTSKSTSTKSTNHFIVAIPSRSNSNTPQPTPQQQQQQQQPVPKPTPPPSQQQQQPQPVRWSLSGSLLFRAGELTWYQNGNTWRLGIVASPSPNPSSPTHTMLPLGHALVPQQPVTKPQSDLRPFHAFSVPPVAVAELKDKPFDQIPWDALFHSAANEPPKRELLALDASKLAASRIDASYSLWCPLSDDPNADTLPYYGCFFGAERIEIGDCLRIKPVPSEPSVGDASIMGLRYIFTKKEYPGAVFFRGNVYRLAKPDSPPASVVPEDQLPVALRDETSWRNQLNPANPRRWVLVKENLTLNEQLVKGRFYPSHRLMPILNPAGFNAALAQGKVDEQVPYLNNRMDGGVGGHIGRKANRMDSLGASVPQGSMISLEPLIKEDGLRVQG
ncbi:transcription-silencing Clr2 domain protein [Metarhizium robertsii]|uniref:Transcription-silencing Clr2 domain protein n=1 Tax=Metarhizium robertsii TaxID=568076 RepID=A0A0A1UUJ7_9HYPO|nr:transcription-silencing Clr2 domain protein [Metarhizium robertsii]